MPIRWTGSSTASTRSSGSYDSALALRRSCAHGICGSDAMVINGVNMLACKVLVKDLKQPITGRADPWASPCIKDLIVDMEPFFAGYLAVKPWLITDEHEHEPGARAHPVTGGARALRRHDQVHPLRGVHDLVPDLLGRRGVRRARRDRQRAPLHLRLARHGRAASDSRSCRSSGGAFKCRTAFNCTAACPRGIKVTKAIQEVKRAALYGSHYATLPPLGSDLKVFARVVVNSSCAYPVILGFQIWQQSRDDELDELQSADAIVVLGAAQYDGEPVTGLSGAARSRGGHLRPRVSPT